MGSFDFGLREDGMTSGYIVMSSVVETSRPIKKRMRFLRFANAPVEMTNYNVISSEVSIANVIEKSQPHKKICIIDFAIIHIFYVA